MAYVTQPTTGEWKHSLFSCIGDPCDCFFAYCCFPCYAYSTAKAAGSDTLCSVFTCCFPPLLCCLRGNTRESRGIDGSIFKDFLATCCCGCCAAIQIRREYD